MRNGKNPKFVYYGVNYLRLIIPKFFFQIRLKKELEKLSKSTDKDYIMQRVNYYNQLDRDSLSAAYDNWRNELIPLKRQPMCKQKVYFFDTFEYTRWFPQSLKWKLCPGDLDSVPNIPSIV